MKAFAIAALAALLAVSNGCVATQNSAGGVKGAPSPASDNSAASSSTGKVKEGGSKNGMSAMAGSMDWESSTSFVGSSNSGRGDYSFGRYEFALAPQMPLLLTTKYQRLSGSSSRPVELYFPGGAFGVAGTKWYIWETDSHWTGWESLPSGVSLSSGSNQLTVLQKGREVIALVNNAEVGRFTLDKNPVDGKASLFFKGDPGRASRVRFFDFGIRTGDNVAKMIADLGPSKKSSVSSGDDGLAGQIALALVAAWIGGAVKETVRQANEVFSDEPYHMAGDTVRICHGTRNFKAKVREVKGDVVEVETAEELDFLVEAKSVYDLGKKYTPMYTVLDVPKRSVVPWNSSTYTCP